MVGVVERRYSNRLFEWISTSMMLGIASTLYLSPHSISASAFRLLLDVLPQSVIADLFFTFGLVRIIALVANGRIPYYGPIMRALCAVGGAVMWFQLGLALFLASIGYDHVSPGVTFYFCMGVGEIVSCYRAAADGSRYRFR